jgi:poly(A) polymerase
MAQKRDMPSLARQAWLGDERLQNLLRVLNSESEARVAGGAVRNALLGVPVADVDIATALPPTDVMRVCNAAGFGVHPTGFDHGTVTITVEKHPFEVTTLRRDIETDGRHAVVSFTKDWAEDAARRDFTINAMYCDAVGKIYDFTNGYADIQKRRMRFVGRPSERIREDYLRILRFFRFHARYGKGSPDKDGLKACIRLKAGLAHLSAERVRQEMFKLLEAPRAVDTIKVMAKSGILGNIIPYTDDWRLLGRLPQDGLMRLFALAKTPAKLKDTFRLSNAQAQRIDALMAAPDVSPRLSKVEQRRMIYSLGHDIWRDAVVMSHARSRASLTDRPWRAMLKLAEKFERPTFPISGHDLAERGITPGPKLGQLLRDLEDWWLASDFKPGKEELLNKLDEMKTSIV